VAAVEIERGTSEFEEIVGGLGGDIPCDRCVSWGSEDPLELTSDPPAPAKYYGHASCGHKQKLFCESCTRATGYCRRHKTTAHYVIEGEL
jgi:hypothetical protein